MQLDLFLHGREAMLVDDLVARIIDGRHEDASGALSKLARERPDHPDLESFDHLLRSLRAGPPRSAAPLGSLIDDLAALAPITERLLGAESARILLSWWKALARTKDAPGPAEAAPRTRYWIGSARWHAGDERGAVRVWLPLCWIEPESFAQQAPTLPSRLVRDAWTAFYADVDHDGDPRIWETPWFPAWLALRHRWVAHVFEASEVPDTEPPLRTLRLLARLLVLEREGYSDDLVRQRTALRAISPSFFRMYRKLLVEASTRPH